MSNVVTAPNHLGNNSGAALAVENEAITEGSGGLEGIARAGVDSYGVKGANRDTSQNGFGVKGEHAGGGTGVKGASGGALGIGVMGVNSYTPPPGQTSPAAGTDHPIGVYGVVADSNGHAGFFQGNVKVEGALNVTGGFITKPAAAFKIDHPTEPDKKFLYHSVVESPDMMCVYSGSVQLNHDGEAAVSLPMWFGALNKDIRYQLTAIGKPAPGLHIAQEVEENEFRIAGGEPAMSVHWQVSGTRNDRFAQRYRIPLEEDKGIYEGKYLHPELYDRGLESGIGGITKEHQHRESCFVLTNESLVELKSHLLPEKITSRLETIKDQTFTGTGNFLAVLRSTIGPKESNHYQSMILQYATCKPEKHPGPAENRRKLK